MTHQETQLTPRFGDWSRKRPWFGAIVRAFAELRDGIKKVVPLVVARQHEKTVSKMVMGTISLNVNPLRLYAGGVFAQKTRLLYGARDVNTGRSIALTSASYAETMHLAHASYK